MNISRNTIIGNVALFAFKLFAGIFAHSTAMVSDAIHSLSDILSTIIVMIGIKLANKKSDKGHPYGHERMECVAAIVLAAILCATGIGIGCVGFQKIFSPGASALAAPGILALIAAAVSVVMKEGMYWYTRIPAKKINSSAMMADAWHHRSDAFSSVGSFAGILGARLGLPILDPIASEIICLLIVKASYDIFMDAIGKMTDRACPDEVEEEIRGVISEITEVLSIDKLKTRLFGDKIYVDVEISANGDATLSEAHDVAERVHNAIEGRIAHVKHCMVHVNPLGHSGSAGEEDE